MKTTSLERDERMKITIGAVVIEPKKQCRLWVSSWSMSSPKLPYNPDNNVTLVQPASSPPHRDGRSLFSGRRPDGRTASKMTSRWPFTLTCRTSPCPRDVQQLPMNGTILIQRSPTSVERVNIRWLLPFLNATIEDANVVPQSLWHYDILTLRYMTSQSPPS
jgi:hypothetical protein